MPVSSSIGSVGKIAGYTRPRILYLLKPLTVAADRTRACIPDCNTLRSKTLNIPACDSGLRFNKIFTISSESRVPYTKTVCVILGTTLQLLLV